MITIAQADNRVISFLMGPAAVGVENGRRCVPPLADQWLITDHMPRYQITSLAGDGGSGKTTVWCALAAAVSSGKRSFIETGWITPFSWRRL